MDPLEDDPDGYEYHQNCQKNVEEIRNRTGVSTGKNSKTFIFPDICQKLYFLRLLVKVMFRPEIFMFVHVA